MSKLLMFVLALACIGAMAFGQGAFHAWNQGQYIVAGSFEGGPVTTGWGPGWDAAGGLDQEWSFTYDGTSFGFDATTEFGSADFANVSAGGGPAVKSGWQPLNWFGTYFKFGSYAKLYMGMPRFNDYSFLSYINGNPTEQRLMDSQWGANLQFFPLSGLALTLTGFLPPANISSTGPDLNFFANFAIGAKYSMTDLFTAFAYYKAIQYDSATRSLQTYGASDDPAILNKKYVDLGLQYVGIPKVGLQAEVAYDFSDVGGTADPQALSAYVGAKTSMFPDTSLALDLFAHYVGGGSPYTVFTAEANGQYDLPNGKGWGLGLNLGYDGGAGQFNGGNGETILSSGPGAGLLLQPYLVYTMDKGAANVKIGFVYLSGHVNNEATGNVATKPSWGIPIVYTWSF